MGTGKTKSDLLPGTLDMLVLKTLMRGHLHGYAIAQLIASYPTICFRLRKALSIPLCSASN
jgi:PadR family transcriptional regulator PadR